MLHKKDPVALLRKLVSIDSQNPPGNEKEIILFIQEFLKNLGVDSKIYEFKKNRLNLVCRLKSKTGMKKLLFTPHVDTVPAGPGGWKFSPFSGCVHHNKLYGRGATDCKINVAAALLLIERLKSRNVRLENLDLIFAFCADEETGSHYGTIPLVKHLKKIDFAVILDADEFNIIVAQKGLLHLRVELSGREAHGAYPQRGINAIEKGINILNEILAAPFTYTRHSLLKKPTLNIGRFSGGDKVNIVAGYAFFELDIRYLPSMNKEKIIATIASVVKKQKIPYRIRVLAHQKPIEIDRNMPSIRILRNVLKKHSIPSLLKPSFGATVINFFQERGIKSFAFGFGSQGNAHIKNESVSIPHLIKSTDVLEGYVMTFDTYIGARKKGEVLL